MTISVKFGHMHKQILVKSKMVPDNYLAVLVTLQCVCLCVCMCACACCIYNVSVCVHIFVVYDCTCINLTCSVRCILLLHINVMDVFLIFVEEVLLLFLKK